MDKYVVFQEALLANKDTNNHYDYAFRLEYLEPKDLLDELIVGAIFPHNESQKVLLLVRLRELFGKEVGTKVYHNFSKEYDNK